MTPEQIEAQLERFAGVFDCEPGDVIPAIGIQIVGDPSTGTVGFALDLSDGKDPAFAVTALTPEQMFGLLRVILDALQGSTMAFDATNHTVN